MGAKVVRDKDNMKSIFEVKGGLFEVPEEEEKEEEEAFDLFEVVKKALKEKKKSRDQQLLELMRSE